MRVAAAPRSPLLLPRPLRTHGKDYKRCSLSLIAAVGVLSGPSWSRSWAPKHRITWNKSQPRRAEACSPGVRYILLQHHTL